MHRQLKKTVAIPSTLIAVLALLAVVGAAAGSGCGSSSSSSTGGGSSATADRAVAHSAVGPAIGAGDGASQKSLSAPSTSGGDISAALPPASAPSAHYLVFNGDLSLLVARGTLMSAVDRIKSTTVAMNGYITSSAIGSQSSDSSPIEPLPLDSSTGSDGSVPRSATTSSSDPYATLVVRVPEQYFDMAIKRFSKLGEVQSLSTSGEDVTSQYVDLQARLRHYHAVERRLVGFLAETTNVNQMLAVQDRIDNVQLTIEELAAQLKSLRETTTYGTLSVYVSEKGRTTAVVHSGTGFGGTLWNSIRLLGRGARAAAIFVTALLPFVVVFGGIGLVAWYVVRRMRRSRRQASQSTMSA